jgi:hypothetical protein
MLLKKDILIFQFDFEFTSYDSSFSLVLPVIYVQRESKKRAAISTYSSEEWIMLVSKGGQTAILVRWFAAQWTAEMLADQPTGKNCGPAPADYRN